jgi:transcriptional regulator with XRE-family HTH domain
VESLGRQIAKHRAELGWTQQDLAERVAVSRVALSHIETGLTVPGERTVALLAGVFGMEPHELVHGTDYPVGKADRLPTVVTRYTEVELQVVLLDRDLEVADPARLRAWGEKIADLRMRTVDRRQLELLDNAENRRRAALRAGPAT